MIVGSRILRERRNPKAKSLTLSCISLLDCYLIHGCLRYELNFDPRQSPMLPDFAIQLLLNLIYFLTGEDNLHRARLIQNTPYLACPAFSTSSRQDSTARFRFIKLRNQAAPTL